MEQQELVELREKEGQREQNMQRHGDMKHPEWLKPHMGLRECK